MHSEANGTWDSDSADALKRFQADQNLTPDGKINSLSLIALGLGPKRLTAQSHAPADPSKADPAKTEAPKADPSKTEPKTEPSKIDPAKPDSSKQDPSKTNLQ